MSKRFWFTISFIFELGLTAFVIFFFLMRDVENKQTPQEITKLCSTETYETFKKFGIQQEDNVVKAIFISIYNTCAVKEGFVLEHINVKEIQNVNFKNNEDFAKAIYNFHESFRTYIFNAATVKTVFESNNELYKDLKDFFSNFKDNKMLDGEVLTVPNTRYYSSIKGFFKRDFANDFKFTNEQKIIFGDRKYNVFDYVHQNFLTIYKKLKPAKA